MKRAIPYIIAGLLSIIVFWQFFLKGYIPMPASYMVAWYEPWKTQYATNGVPTIPHKAVGLDVFRQLFPFKDFMVSEVMKGQIPLWNPYNGSGQPMMATLQPGFFNPFSYLLLFGKSSGWAWYIIVQFPLLFLATYWYGRKISLSVYGAILAAVAVCFSGVVSARLSYGEYVYPFITLPLLFGMVELVRVKQLATVVLSVPWIVTFLLVSVQPQLSVYFLIAFGLYAVIRLQHIKHVSILFGTTCIGIGIASIQLIPTLELYTLANVTAASSAFIFEKFLMPISHIVTILIPNYFGNSGTYNFWGHVDYTETVVSMGCIPVFLACIAWIKKGEEANRSIIRYCIGGIIITIALTVDWPLTRFLYALPYPILSTSIPTRLYLLTSFFIAILAGIGVDAWFQDKKHPGIRSYWRIGASFVALCSVIIGITAWLVKYGSGCPAVIPTCYTVALRNTLLEVCIGGAGIALLYISLMRYAIKIRSVFVIGVIALLIGMGTYNTAKILPFSPSTYVAAPHALLTQLASFAPSRMVGIGGASLLTDLATQYKIFDTNYYNPLYIRRYGELVSYVNTGHKEIGLTRSDIIVTSDATVSAEVSYRRERFWDMTGTSVEAVKKSEAVLNGNEVLWEDNHWMVRKRPTALPRAYLVSHLSVETDPNEELVSLFAKDTDLTKTAFVDTSVLFVPDVFPGEKKVHITTYEPNTVAISVETPSDAFLVLSDVYYPGWQASVDGKPTDVYRTNYAFRGVVVPKGKHRIVFSYEPNSLRVGLYVTLCSLFVWIFVLVRYGVIKLPYGSRR